MIERYEPYAKVFSSQGQRTNVEAVMQLHPTGSFVHFTVYDALAARLAEAERVLRYFRDMREVFGTVPGDWREQAERIIGPYPDPWTADSAEPRESAP